MSDFRRKPARTEPVLFSEGIACRQLRMRLPCLPGREAGASGRSTHYVRLHERLQTATDFARRGTRPARVGRDLNPPSALRRTTVSKPSHSRESGSPCRPDLLERCFYRPQETIASCGHTRLIRVSGRPLGRPRADLADITALRKESPECLEPFCQLNIRTFSERERTGANAAHTWHAEGRGFESHIRRYFSPSLATAAPVD